MRRDHLAVLVLVLCTAAALADEPTPKGPDARLKVQLFEPLAVEALAGNAGLFVGIGEFPNDEGVSSLSFATHDAIELAYLFSLELQLIPPRNCYLALGGEPTADAVKGHLEQLRRAGAKITSAERSRILLTLRQVKGIAQDPSNFLICSFSSHGFQDRADPYVMPSDGVRDLLADTAVPLKTIETMMQDSKAGHRLLLVDACQERVSAKAVGDDQLGQPVPKAFQEALAIPTGQAKFASCSPGEYSFEHGSLGGVGHGVFTWEFLAALRGKADVGTDNIVRLGDVAKSVSMNVTAWSKSNRQRAQTPFLQSPVETLQLPLAMKADDLKTLIAELQKLPTGPLFTPELQRALIVQLERSNPEDEADRKLLTATRDFAAGRLSAEFFGPYLERDQRRWDVASDARAVLLFDGSRTEVILPPLPLPGRELTVETWVRLDALPDRTDGAQHVTPVWHWSQLSANVHPSRQCWICDVWRSEGRWDAVGNFQKASASRSGVWSHVAVVLNDSDIRLFVDGEFAGDKVLAETVGDVNEFWKQLSLAEPRIGSRKLGNEGRRRYLKGQVCEFRVSSKARYRDRFKPDARLSADESTLALYHMDEGDGDVLHDASGHGRDARIAGATWVLRDAGPFTPTEVETLLARLDGIKGGPSLDATLRTKLSVQLQQADSNNEADRKLLAAARDFITGDLSPEFFVPFVERDQRRWDSGDDAGVFLEFNGQSGDIPLPRFTLPGKELTIEAWVRPRPPSASAARTVVPCCQIGPASLELSYLGDWYSIGLLRTDNQSQGISSSGPNNRNRADVQWNKWTHIAAVLTADAVTLYVDGAAAGSRPADQAMGDVERFWRQLQDEPGRLGSRYIRLLDKSPRYWNGGIGEFRVSSTARYQRPFSPPARFTSDSSTLVLYHLDEGSGNLLHDVSGQGGDARIVGAAWARPIVNSLGMKLMPIPAGEFLMGTPDSEPSHSPDEGPQHRVRLDQPYFLATHEVNQTQWQAVMGFNRSAFAPTGQNRQAVTGMNTAEFPVERLTWFDAISFCNRLSALEGLDPYYRLSIEEQADRSIVAAQVEVLGGVGYRLPTEAEWEFACRAGTTGPCHWEGPLDVSKANVLVLTGIGENRRRISLERTTLVGQYAPNGYGLYDMIGNVSEWCFDGYVEDAYARRSNGVESPLEPGSPGGDRCIRGASFAGGSDVARCGDRQHYNPAKYFETIGLRVARSTP